MAGHLVASHDQPGRRYPFLMMRTLDVIDPAAFVSRCPLAFAPLWSFLAAAAPPVLGAGDPTLHLQGISDAAITLGECEESLAAFLARGTIGELSDLLDGEDASRIVLALGLLIPLAGLDNRIDAWLRASFGVSSGLILSGSVFVVVLAYTIRFLAVSLGALEAGFERLSPNLDAAARTLGETALSALGRVHLPLLLPALGAAGLVAGMVAIGLALARRRA